MSSRPLTQGEIDLAKTVFGNAIDYTQVKVCDGTQGFFQRVGMAMTVSNNLYMNDMYRDDYGQPDADYRHIFIHEMAHVWQYQNKVLNPVVSAVQLNLRHKFNYDKAYFFELDEKKDLTDYGMEQQAAMIEEYFLIKKEGLSSYVDRCQNDCDDAERLRLYEKVLEKFLQDPSYAKKAKFPKAFKNKKPPNP